jgi:RNA polymerase sigma factor (sigma-70 family)
MAAADDRSTTWLRQLVAGNDEVVAEFWQHYGDGLQRLAASRMAPALRQRVGAEDIVQSVCRTFFRRSREGEFEFGATDDLWRLLCAITLTKVRQHARFHYQEKRQLSRERPLDDARPGSAARRVEPVAAGPTPAEVVEFTDQLQHLLSGLSDEERQMVQLRIEGRQQAEIAGELGCSERTVRRLFSGVKTRWEQMLGDEAGGSAS